jgi:hypothetical protein
VSAARKDPQHTGGPVDVREVHRSGEHSIELDRLVRRAFEDVFEADVHATSQLSRFELEAVLASPEARPSEPPPLAVTPIVGIPIVNVVSEGIAIEELPPPAIEIDRTKEQERDPE